jgi:hypothetical protein
MAQKHEIMAKLQAARQNSPKIVETETQKAYPDTPKSGQLEISQFLEEVELPKADPSSDQKDSLQEEGHPAGNLSGPDADKEQKKTAEKVSYTTISVPKQYGQKAKLYATLLKVNMVEFTCVALDTYILQMQENGKLPRVDL